MLLDPNTKQSEISDQLLLQEFENPKRFAKMHLYALMARRANTNHAIKLKLFEQILNADARLETVVGSIKHSWIPAIYLLQEGTDNLRIELKGILKEWTLKEREHFLDYVKKDQEYYSLLFDIIDKSEEE
ncbi:hypothetical protein [Phaeodactylibacter xiamenensis]|uniref:hypothetical protein n=1 Tax=Phaeodactylibacter xiamenensis TaxID=1524460 RepID=UPI003BABB501